MTSLRQRQFETSVDRLLAQGGPSTRGGECRYRGDGGRVCALLPDRLVSWAEEGLSAGTLLQRIPEIREELGLAYTEGERWRGELRGAAWRLAARWGLAWPPRWGAWL